MARVRQHGPRRRIKYEGEVYEWPDDAVLEVDGPVARALVRAHQNLTLEPDGPRLHHDPKPAKKAAKKPVEAKGKPEEDAPGGD